MTNILLKLQHAFNPLHIYVRLVKMGYNKKKSLKVCKWYEKTLHLCFISIIQVLWKISVGYK